MRGKIGTETVRNREAIVITEIPYMLNKTSLIEQIARLIQDRKIKDISDLRDESSRGKMRIVLDLKRGANSKFMYSITLRRDSCQVSYSFAYHPSNRLWCTCRVYRKQYNLDH